MQTLSVFKDGDVLPTLLGSANNLTITIDNGTYVLGDLSEALISGPPSQACNVRQCLQTFSTHAHVSLGPCGAQATAYPCSMRCTWVIQTFPLGVLHLPMWLPGHAGGQPLPCKHWMPLGVTVAHFTCNLMIFQLLAESACKLLLQMFVSKLSQCAAAPDLPCGRGVGPS